MRLVRVVIVFMLLTVSFLAHAAAVSGSDAIQIGYARLLPSPGAELPNGIAIFGYQNGGMLINETAVPASSLIESGRIFVDGSGAVNTGLALANPGSQDAVISFYFTAATGHNFGSGTFTLPSQNQMTAFLTAAPFNGPTNVQGTFTFTSSTPISTFAMRGTTNERGDYLTASLPISPIAGGFGGNTIAFPQFAGNGSWTTQFVLINPGNTPLNGSLQIWGQGTRGAPKLVRVTIGGITNSAFGYAIPARSAVTMSMNSLSDNARVDAIKIVPGAGNDPSGFAIFSFENTGITVSTPSVSALPAGKAFRTYVELSGAEGQNGSIQTGFALSNPSGFPVTAQLSLNNMDGSTTGLSTSVTIPAGGQVVNLVSALLQLPSTFKGILSFTAASPFVANSLRARYNQRGDLLVSTISPWNEAAPPNNSEMDFPYIVNGGGYSTELFLVSPGAFAASGTLSLLSQTGTNLSTVQLQPLP